MEVIQRVRVACPRCQAPVTGDFKFCPTCAYRLKPGAPLLDPDAGPRRRNVASTLFLIGAALFVALIAGVGFWLFRDPAPTEPPPTSGSRSGILPPEKLRAENVRTYLRHIPEGTAYWSKDQEDVTRRVQVEALDVLLYETPSAFYAEFLTGLRDRLAEGGMPGPTLQRLWNASTDEERQFARQYLQFWTETYLRNTGATSTDATPPPKYLLEFVPQAQRQEAAGSIEALAQAVPFPWPHELGLLLLAPPIWVYENPWEELRWRIPLNGDALPVTDVAWMDAMAFCEWLTEHRGGELRFRLPTRGEWMRVAHGNHAGESTEKEGWSYPWGNALLTNACNNAELYATGAKPGLHPVSQRYIDMDLDGASHDGRTVDGVFGMAGNAAEWVLLQGDQPVRDGEDLRAYYDDADERERVRAMTLGGSFRSTISECAIEKEPSRHKSERSDDLGFRIVAVPRGR